MFRAGAVLVTSLPRFYSYEDQLFRAYEYSGFVQRSHPLRHGGLKANETPSFSAFWLWCCTLGAAHRFWKNHRQRLSSEGAPRFNIGIYQTFVAPSLGSVFQLFPQLYEAGNRSV